MERSPLRGKLLARLQPGIGGPELCGVPRLPERELLYAPAVLSLAGRALVLAGSYGRPVGRTGARSRALAIPARGPFPQTAFRIAAGAARRVTAHRRRSRSEAPARGFWLTTTRLTFTALTMAIGHRKSPLFLRQSLATLFSESAIRAVKSPRHTSTSSTVHGTPASISRADPRIPTMRRSHTPRRVPRSRPALR